MARQKHTLCQSLHCWDYCSFAGCEGDTTTPRALPESVVKPDSVSMAVLLVGYQTYEFKGGAISYRAQRSPTASDTLPLYGWRLQRGDFSWTLFEYSSQSEPVFFASQVWAGTGRIHIPNRFSPPGDFISLPDSVPPPELPRCLLCPPMPPDTLEMTIRRVWAAVSRLKVVHDFHDPMLRVGYYPYFPSMTLGGEAFAVWVVFLCRERRVE